MTMPAAFASSSRMGWRIATGTSAKNLKKRNCSPRWSQKGKPEICKDKVEDEVLFAVLPGLNSSDQFGRSKIDGWSNDGFYLEDKKDLISTSPRDSSTSTGISFSSPDTSLNASTLPIISSSENSEFLERSDVTNMHIKGLSSDITRVSTSSAPSTASHSSSRDDCFSLGDVYVWGEVICEDSEINGADKFVCSSSGRTDFLLPKPLESNLVLDVHQVACGVRHAALVTRHGEVFTWGEESGGRLGHGVGTYVHPHQVESLAACSVEFVACGDFHTCAVTVAGEFYTWGDGTQSVGLLGHGTDVSHWIPKRVSGPLEGLQVAYATCGTWHTALITSTGQLFTFGDGTFGALGHGTRQSMSSPREVESLVGLKTVAVACGVWHTAAVVEVIVTQSSVSISSGKLFTWGDGDKHRLGHGDREPRLKPTCVSSLIEHNFHKVACGHSLTVGLTTSGHVFTMGNSVYGQIGNPRSDGKFPCLVEDMLATESVQEVACGSYHVAVLTTRNEVFTWGKGANGRLGHGDLEDRNLPTRVEALRDRAVRHIACGANFTAAICQHKWMISAEHSHCASCRHAFGFTRRRHHCYNCGLVLCHSCSTRKSLGAALSPIPGKPYRVCDSCYIKLNKVLNSGVTNNKKNDILHISGENKDSFDKVDIKSAKAILPVNLDMIIHLDLKAAKHGKKTDSLSFIQTPQITSLLHLKDIALAGGLNLNRAVCTSTVQSVNSSRAASPFSRKNSPLCSATPLLTPSGLSFSKSVADSLKRTNELLNQEVQKLHAQVHNLRQRCDLQEVELQQFAKKAQEAMAVAAEESAKSKAAKEVIKSLTAQLKDMAEKLPQIVQEGNEIKAIQITNGFDLHINHHSNLNGVHQSGSNPRSDLNRHLLHTTISTITNGISGQHRFPDKFHETDEKNTLFQNDKSVNAHETEDHMNRSELNDNEQMPTSKSRADDNVSEDSEPLQNGENGTKSRSTIPCGNHVEAEWIEQYEPGVYITLTAHRDGTRDLKRVRFSRRRFGEHQAEAWWSENREKVYERYNVHGSHCSSGAAITKSIHQLEEEF